jgi:hypothetical protein
MTTENQLLYLHIYSKKKGRELFDVSQRFDLYVIEKIPKYNNTNIVDELGNNLNLNLSEWFFLPNYNYKNLQKIMTTEQNGIKIIFSSLYDTRTLKDIKTEKFKHPIVHSINGNGLVFWFTDDKTKGHFGIPKVILNLNEIQYSYPEQNDYTGKYGMSQLSFGIPIRNEKEGKDILKAIETEEFKEMIKATKWATFQTEPKMFKYFKPNFYKYFLREEAGKTIKKFITKKHQERKNKTKKTSPKSGGTRKRIRSRHTKRYYFW